MKIFYLLTFGVHVLVFSTTAQITFEKTYGGNGTDVAFSIQQTSDEGYIIAGSSQSFGSGLWSVYLVKTSITGDTLWTRSYAGVGNNQGYSVRQTSDSGYIVAGITESYSRKVYLIKTSSYGDTLWTRSYGDTDAQGYSVKETSDGGYIIAGTVWSSTTSYDAYLIKTNASGDTLWTKTYGGSDRDVAYSVLQTRDGGYAFTGYSWSFGDSAYTAYLIKTDALGRPLWIKTCGRIRFTLGTSIESTSSGGYIVGGMIDSLGNGQGHQHPYVIMADSLGDTVWTKIYSRDGPGLTPDLKRTMDNAFIFVASGTGPSGPSGSSTLVKINPLGDTIWTRRYDGIFARSVQQTTDGGYIFAGNTLPIGTGSGDFYVIKTNELGIVTTVTKDAGTWKLTNYALSQNFPNPFNPTTTIYYEVPKTSKVTLEIFDILGHTIATLLNETQLAGEHSISWNALEYPSGIYFYRFTATNFSETKKLLLLK